MLESGMEELRGKGVAMLDTALAAVQDAQSSSIEAGRKMADSVGGFVKDNPWRAMAVLVGVGLLLGALMGRR
jgi:ElaB/YqjD/DUF883 family membrane-anchored ribosome-binding protein